MPPSDPVTPPEPGNWFAATLVDEWVHQGVTDAVVCPGSRSTPLAVALAEHPDVRVHVHLDERSGAFMALGLGMATGRPAVVVTTSGTAAVELHPAVVEADHQHVPLLAVTADRPPELQDCGAPQTIDQRHLYGKSVRWYAEPGPADPAAISGWRPLAADSVASTMAGRPGPVHLDLAFREPLIGPPGPLPQRNETLDRPPSPVWGLRDESVARLTPLLGRRGLIVAGARAALDERDATALLDLATALGWPVLADPLSGVRVPHPAVVTTFDPVLRHAPTADVLRPEVVLHVGGLLASRVANEWLASSGAVHLGIDRHGRCPDPYGVLADSFHADVLSACSALRAAIDRLGVEPVDGWSEEWQRTERSARAAIDRVLADEPDSEPAVAARVLAELPDGGELVVSSSMPVRDLEWYAPPRAGVAVRANRGANGIDGVVSTAVGVALAGRPTTLLIGDVAFLHDTNGLIGLAGRPVDLRIVVIDNDGGGIFSFLPQAGVLEPARFEQLFGTPHGADLEGLAAAHRVTHMVEVVRSDRAANVEVHRRLGAAVAEAIG